MIYIEFLKSNIDLITLFFVFLYAEIHLYIPILRGILYRKQPEIIFDTPYRIHSNELPILLLLKDADKFPVELKEVHIEILDKNSGELILSKNFTENTVVSAKWFSKIYRISTQNLLGKTLEISCKGIFHKKGKEFIVHNDNYPGLSHKNLTVYIDPEPLPAEEGWVSGDLHCHSYYTEDQVEFGLPVYLFPEIGLPMGLSFCGITDHSYDLDDKPGTWTKFDPRLYKYHKSREEIANLNKKYYNNYILIPGEELTVDNGDGKHVHMLVLNNKHFIPGNADGFEGLFDHKISRYYAEIAELADGSMLTASAHPLTKFPLVQQIVLKRGLWKFNDKTDCLDGHQILNGKIDDAFKKGKELWVRQLLSGQRKYIYAGNDSHGNLNRFRQLRTPLLKLYERDYQIFGECRTMVKFKLSEGMENLVRALKTGQVIVSNGPFVNIGIKTSDGEIVNIGSEVSHQNISSLSIVAKSSKFFGRINRISIFHGKTKDRNEHRIFEENVEQRIFDYRNEIKLNNIHEGYIRAEIYTEKGKFALSNPIWVV